MKEKEKQKNVKKKGRKEKKKKRGILQIWVGVLSLISKGDFLNF